MTFKRWQDRTPCEFDQDDTNIYNETQTSFGGATPAVAVRFIAPTSGRVLLTCGGGARGDGTNRAYISPQVFEDFGGATEEVTPSSTNNGLIVSRDTTAFFFAQRTILVEGLSPGRRYVARPRIAVAGGSGCDFAARDILVEPVP